MSKGIITQVIGAVVDVKFDGELPEIYTALEVKNEKSTLILDWQRHLLSALISGVKVEILFLKNLKYLLNL